MVWAMMFSTKSTHLEKAKAAKVGHQTNSKRCFHKRRLSLPTMAYLFSATLAIYVFCLFLLKAWSSVTPCFVCSLSCFRKRRMHPSSLPKERTAPTSTKKPKSSLRKHLPTFEPWKKLLLFIESWLFNKDPYNGLWNNRHITGQYDLLYALTIPNQPGALFALLIWWFFIAVFRKAHTTLPLHRIINRLMHHLSLITGFGSGIDIRGKVETVQWLKNEQSQPN